MKVYVDDDQFDELKKGYCHVYYSGHLTVVNKLTRERIVRSIQNVEKISFSSLPKSRQNLMYYGEDEPVIHYELIKEDG